MVIGFVKLCYMVKCGVNLERLAEKVENSNGKTFWIAVHKIRQFFFYNFISNSVNSANGFNIHAKSRICLWKTHI